MTKQKKKSSSSEALGRFEHNGSEFTVFKKAVKINDTKWRKLKK